MLGVGTFCEKDGNTIARLAEVELLETKKQCALLDEEKHYLVHFSRKSEIEKPDYQKYNVRKRN